MASSAEKAIGLKDAYVKGILDSAATEGGVSLKQGAFDGPALAGAMGAEQGNTAGVALNLQQGIGVSVNDGNPRLVITDGNRKVTKYDSSAANPRTQQFAIPPQMQREAQQTLYSGPNEMDGITDYSNGPRDFYRNSMKGGFTPSYAGGRY